MKRDPLFFRLFKELPICFFQLLGRTSRDADRYELEAIEYKSTAVRLDGVFRPRDPDAGPAYIWEAQYYHSDKVYANLLTKIGRFLKRGDADQDWVAVVIYPNRALEQQNLRPYRGLLQSDQLVRIYLDEMPPAAPDQFEMGILQLIAVKPDLTLEKAKGMVPRLRQSKLPTQVQRMMVQFIETIVLHQFPKWSREEIERMLQVTDVRETRVFQEALEEGREEEKQAVVRRMIELGRPIAEIVQVSGLTEAQIRKLAKKPRK